MSTRVLTVIAIACLLVVPRTVFPQAATPANQAPSSANQSISIPKDLGGMLDAALRSNPEVLQAEASVRQAQADLNQVRLAVTQKVVSAFHERRKQKELLDYFKEQAEILARRVATGTAPADEAHKARAEMTEARAALAQSEARLHYILGAHYPGTRPRAQGSASGGSPAALPGAPGSAGPSTAPPPEIPEKVRGALGVPLTLIFDDGEALSVVIAQLGDLTGQNFIFDESARLEPRVVGPIQLSNLTLRNVLLAIADRTEACFVFRDYGVLVTTPERARTMRSASIPPREEILERPGVERAPDRR